MKVLFFLDKFPSFSETFIRDQIIHLKKRSVEVLIWADYFIKKEEESLLGMDKYDLLNFTCFYSQVRPKTHFKLLFSIVSIYIKSFFTKEIKIYSFLLMQIFLFKKGAVYNFYLANYILKNSIDVIHVHFGTTALKSIFFKKIKPLCKLIVTFHGYDLRLGISKENDYSELFQYANAIIAISEYNKNELLKLGVDEEKLFLLSNGVDVSFFKKKTRHINKKIQFLSVARLVKEKALDIAIKSVSELVSSEDIELEYTIIGEGNQRVYLQALINELQMDKVITLVGAKNSFQVKKSLEKADALLLSSIAEALPTILLEAQAFEVPVLATNVGAVKGIVRGGFVVEPDTESFKKGLRSFVANKLHWEKIGKDGREFILQEHNIKDKIIELVNLYHLC